MTGGSLVDVDVDGPGTVYVALGGHVVEADGTCTRLACRGRRHPYVLPVTDPTRLETPDVHL